MAGRPDPLAARIGRRVVRAYCVRAVRRSVGLSVEGRENLRRRGPMLLAARHAHHLLDGCILTAIFDRPLHVLVAVDWSPPGPQRRLLDAAAGLLRWPTIVRADAPSHESKAEARRRLRRATREAVDLLREGRIVLVFPEGYPNIDPHPNAKIGLDDFLPFRAGVAHLARLAECSGAGHVPIVPVGFSYRPLPGDRWRVVVRIGEPMSVKEFTSTEQAALEIEQRVRALSVPPEAAT